MGTPLSVNDSTEGEATQSIYEPSRRWATGLRRVRWREVIVGAVLGAMEDVITSTVAGGGKVQLPGFLSFEKADRAARTGRNPATGAEIQIAATTVPKVKVGKSFKDAVK